MSAYGGLARFQVGRYAVHGSLLHQGYHRWGREYAQVTTAYMSGQVMLLDGACAGVGKSGL